MAHQLSNPDYLYRLARSGSTQDKESLAQAMTSLLHIDLSENEAALTEGILLHLVREAEMDLRESLAEILALEKNCPQALLDFLVYENPFAVAQPVLRHSQALSDDKLIDIAKHFDAPGYWRTMAQREQVSDRLALFLIGTDDEETYTHLVKNTGADLNGLSINWLTSLAIHIPALHTPLLLRPEINEELATKLYWHVSEDLRAQVLQRFGIAPAALDKALQYVQDHRAAQKAGDDNISAATLDLSVEMKQHNKITSRQIMEALRKNDVLFFTSLWATLFEIKAEKLLELLKQQPITTLAVLCRAAQMTKADFNTLFLQWRRQRSASSVTNATELTQAMAVFNAMKIEQAKDEIAAWQQGQMSAMSH